MRHKRDARASDGTFMALQRNAATGMMQVMSSFPGTP